MSCLDETTLRAYVDGRLSQADAAAAENHLEVCRRCAERLEPMIEQDELLQQARDAEAAREKIQCALDNLDEVRRSVSSTIFSPPPAS